MSPIISKKGEVDRSKAKKSSMIQKQHIRVNIQPVHKPKSTSA